MPPQLEGRFPVISRWEREFSSRSPLPRAIGALAFGGGHASSRVPRSNNGTAPASTRIAGTRKAPRYRYIFFSHTAAAKVASYGWNLIDVDSKELADGLPKGTRGLIWIGDYDNVHCSLGAVGRRNHEEDQGDGRRPEGGGVCLL